MSVRRRSRAIAYALEGDGQREPVVIEGCGHMTPEGVKRAGPCDSCKWVSGEMGREQTVAPPLDYYPRKGGG